MAMSNRNNRSIHGDAKRIKANLAEHQKRMAAYIARGFCKLHASTYAYKDMCGVTNPSEAPGSCEECIRFDEV